jgi:hypothetical protein
MKKLLPKNPIKILFICAIMAIPLITIAEDNEESPAIQENKYLTPDKMTREDFEMLNEYSANYEQCLTEISVNQMEVQTDPRVVVDIAMKSCASMLEELNRIMTDQNYDPALRQGYIHRVSKRGANSTLRVVMMGMAAKQSQQDIQQDQTE